MAAPKQDTFKKLPEPDSVGQIAVPQSGRENTVRRPEKNFLEGKHVVLKLEKTVRKISGLRIWRTAQTRPN